MKRKMLCLSLLLIIVVLVVAACGGNETESGDGGTVVPPQETVVDQGANQDTTEAGADQPGEDAHAHLPIYLRPMAERITLGFGVGYGTPEGNVPPGTIPSTSAIPAILSEFLNIEMDFLWEVPTAQADDRFQLALVAGDMPDIMRLDAIDFAELSRFGMLRDLGPAFERYAHPEIRAMFDYFGNVPLEMSTVDGQLMAIPYIWDTHQQISLLFYRRDWLDALGLAVPTTMDEMHAVAVAFVENDMSGQGNTTGLGLFSELVHWAPDARGLFHGYGAYPTKWIERGGELVFGTIQPETRDALNRMRRMYADGAINPEFATMNTDQLVADIVGDRVGLAYGEWWLPAWPFNQTLDTNPNADWGVTRIVTPSGAPGITAISRNNINHRFGVSVNAPEGTEEALIRMLNLWWEISYVRPSRVDLNPYNTAEAGFVWNWMPAYLMLGHEQYLNYTIVHEALRTGDTSTFFNNMQWNLYTNTRWRNEGATFYDVVDNWNTPTASGAWGLYMSRVDHDGGWGTTMQVREDGHFIFDEFYGDPTPTEISRGSILHDMWEEFALRYIMGALPYDSWYTFVNDWRNLGGDDWTREVNEQFRALQ